MGEIARTTTNSASTYPSRYRDGELIVHSKKMSHVYLRRFKREVHFELRTTSFKRSLAFSLQILAAPRSELFEAWLAL